ncbi:tetratricopeptide repeat protein [Fusobacterium polymorphum]|uniref:Uncharacterized protein n=2 Tax=Fusobacterium nucleatum subsp. polymorphum TaxID=76857 RepID=A0A241Q1V1_FUSNP|nr:tetratricopeptide repeat protein [Fusobacterium polymorphum]ASG28793.1 hypothetical protein CBG61_07625 [Fusobacterium polymorphum]
MNKKEKEELLKEIKEYTQKIKEEPDNAIYYYNRGNTYKNLGDYQNAIENYDKAIQDYSKAIELNPNNASYFDNRGNIYFDLENYDKAIQDFNKAIELNSNNVSYFDNRGNIYFNLENYDKAIQDFNKAIELNPNNALTYYNRGSAYNNLKNYDKAIQDFNKAIELNSNNASYFNNRGSAYGNLKNYKKAIQDFNKAIELNPNNPSYFYNRGNAYGNSEKYEEAIQDFNKAIELNPNNPSYFYNRGNAYGNLKNYKKAIQDFNKAIELNPNNPSYYYNRGITYEDLGESDKAINDFNNVIKLDPNSNFAMELKKVISTLKENEKKENIQQNNKIIYTSKDKKNYEERSDEEFQKVKKDFSSLKENDNDFQEKISTDEDERNKKINKNFEDALDLHLNAETDEEFQKAEEDFSSFIKTYKDFPDKPPALENLLTEASSYLVASKFRVKRLVGYLTFADILGWKGIWQKQNTDVGKIDNIRKLLSIKDNLNKKFLNDESFHNVKLISDTFVIYSRSFELSNKLSKELIKLCLEKELLIRGATSYGECYNKDMVYIGQAVDEAASWHEKGEEIGIFYTSSARLSKNLNDDELEKYYLKNNEVNTKHGKIKTYFINWYNETTEKKFYEIMKKEIIYPEISLKYFNTENRLNEILHPEEKEKK